MSRSRHCGRSWIGGLQVGAAIGAILLGGPINALGQAPQGELLDAIEGIPLLRTLRVGTMSGDGSMTGRFLGLSESGLLLEVVERQPSVIPANQVMVLHERRQAWRKGLWIGAGAGVVVGALIGAWSAGFSPLDDPAETALVGGFVCGLIGGVLGVAVGSAITEWHLLYPMDAP